MVDHISREVHHFRKRLLELNEEKGREVKILAEILAMYKENLLWDKRLEKNISKVGNRFLKKGESECKKYNSLLL